MEIVALRAWRIFLNQHFLVVSWQLSGLLLRTSTVILSLKMQLWLVVSMKSRSMHRRPKIPIRSFEAFGTCTKSTTMSSCRMKCWKRLWITLFSIFHNEACQTRRLTWSMWLLPTWQPSIQWLMFMRLKMRLLNRKTSRKRLLRKKIMKQLWMLRLALKS